MPARAQRSCGDAGSGAIGHHAYPKFSSLKKSLPLSSMMMKAGKSDLDAPDRFRLQPSRGCILDLTEGKQTLECALLVQ
jgi:hypothetical protein